MKKISKNYSEICVGLLVIVSLVLGTNAFGILMPSRLAMIITTLAVVLFMLFLVLVWHENPRDEREQLHIAFSDRFAFYVGSIVLCSVIIFQVIKHVDTTYSVVALSCMLLAKVVAKAIQK